MLDFRILSGAVVVAVLIMAGILLSFDDRDVAVATLPRPNIETVLVVPAEPAEPAVAPSKEIVIQKPIRTPAVTTAAAPAPAPPAKEVIVQKPIQTPAVTTASAPAPANDITGSIGPAAAARAETAPPPKPRARVAAKKPDPEPELFNPLKLFFPFVDFTKSPFPSFVKQE
jgi:hypothetical protein